MSKIVAYFGGCAVVVLQTARRMPMEEAGKHPTRMSRFPRSSGILCHVTCLPGRWGIGDLGGVSDRFVDWLARAGQGLWQVLPLGPLALANPLIRTSRRLPETRS